MNKTESQPPGKTLYLKMNLNIPNTPPEVGIFIPERFRVGSHVDLILYMRGFKIADNVVDIESYFKKDYGKLREGVNASGRNVILIAPALGPKSEAGNLLESGGLDRFLSQALAAILAHGGFVGPPTMLTLGHLILACHSGGGAPVRRMAGGNDRALANLKESWGYDSLNSRLDVPFWSAWAAVHVSERLRLYYLPNGTPVAERCVELGDLKLANLTAQKSKAPDHMHVPIAHWQASLKGAEFLARRPGFKARG